MWYYHIQVTSFYSVSNSNASTTFRSRHDLPVKLHNACGNSSDSNTFRSYHTLHIAIQVVVPPSDHISDNNSSGGTTFRSYHTLQVKIQVVVPPSADGTTVSRWYHCQSHQTLQITIPAKVPLSNHIKHCR